MSHVIQARLHCDGYRCDVEYVSDARTPGQARRWAERAGWAAGIQDARDGRRRRDYCPACKAAYGRRIA